MDNVEQTDRGIKFTIECDQNTESELCQAFDSYWAAHKALASAQVEIRKELEHNTVFDVAKKLSKAPVVVTPMQKFHDRRLIQVEMVPEYSTKSLNLPARDPYMDPKTLNTLLSGKLLTDEDKKLLLRGLYPNITTTLVESEKKGLAAQSKAYEVINKMFNWLNTQEGLQIDRKVLFHKLEGLWDEIETAK